VELIFGAGKLDSRVSEVEILLGDWREKERDFGQLYLEHEPTTPRDRVFVEVLAVTMLINSRVEARQAMGVFRNGSTLDLGVLPDKALDETTDGERQVVAEVVAAMTTWPGIGASVATKTLHKKRPALIPSATTWRSSGRICTRCGRRNERARTRSRLYRVSRRRSTGSPRT
jgi:hypothetical protein